MPKSLQQAKNFADRVEKGLGCILKTLLQKSRILVSVRMEKIFPEKEGLPQ